MDKTYSKANGLNAPHNAALLARYLTTQDPQVLKQLTESLKKTPRRAAIERDQQESLDKSQVVNFLTNHMDGGDYAQVMAEAGNPLEIVANLVPLLRGARIASQAGKSALKMAGSAVGSVAADIALESVNLAVENPDAALADYLSNGRDVVAAALGLHGAGMVAGKTGQVMGPVIARAAESAGDHLGKALNELVPWKAKRKEGAPAALLLGEKEIAPLGDDINPESEARAPVGLMHSNDRFLKIYNDHADKLSDPEFFDVVAHGSATQVSLQLGSLISANKLREYMIKGGYKGGPVRLCACKTGELPPGNAHGIAQALANKLRVKVRAPSKDLVIRETFSKDRAYFSIEDDHGLPGQWIDFEPIY
ncbi:hypothetical protein EI77_04764 [Prosthecobacter fusiformis]|uniref:Uncharacterized protein n=1 Tax=Prosthecobacter fusiformis TaxID=48464 RepID=A0A4R7RJ20_9BACT|nr:hypothetical protein [Prosthecobacter fusiformis]TDU62082.1 hypothetical protein EI77_04764 [Prosthecobacter fusiformis]